MLLSSLSSRVLMMRVTEMAIFRPLLLAVFQLATTVSAPCHLPATTSLSSCQLPSKFLKLVVFSSLLLTNHRRGPQDDCTKFTVGGAGGNAGGNGGSAASSTATASASTATTSSASTTGQQGGQGNKGNKGATGGKGQGGNRARFVRAFRG